jgi:hypothetical protein
MNVTNYDFRKHRHWITPKANGKINIDDALIDAELSAIAFAKLKTNGNHSQQNRYCDCAECIVNGKRIPCPPQHSCDYTRARSALVPAAVRLAIKQHGDTYSPVAFGAIMDRLSSQLGI